MSDVRIEEIKKRYGFEDFVNLVKSAGKRVTPSGRCQCPMEGCAHKGPKAALDAQIFPAGGVFRLVCHSCGEEDKRPDFIEVYQRVHGITFSEALRQLGDAPLPPARRPALRVLPAPVLGSDKDKLSSDKVRELWGALSVAEPQAEAYLEGRRLHDAVGLGYVRFAAEDSVVESFQRYASKGWRVGLLLSDVLGRPLGIQFRSIESGIADGEKLRSLKGGHGRGVFFGRPGEILDSHTVVVTEGVADTLAALIWTKGHAGTVVVGAPGKDQVPVLAEALAEHSIELRGRTFVLLAQHDRGKRGNQSLHRFTQLSQALRKGGAEVLQLNEPPGDHAKDWADAWKENELPAWPPTQLQRRREADDSEAEETTVRAPGAAIWQVREPIEPEYYARDLRTLEWLLSADQHRRPMLGEGNWELNELTGRLEYGGRPMIDTDYTRICLNLESYQGSMDRKQLKFAPDVVKSIARVLGEKNAYHPVRRYVTGLQWDGQSRRTSLASALGLRPDQTLEQEYLSRWMMSAAARATRPGCKADAVLVLYGAQGILKSTFFSVLGGEWYSASSAELGTRDAIQLAHSNWLIELDELSAVHRSKEESTVTAFLTRPHDDFIPKYSNEKERFPRSSVYCGTTNEAQFLTDPTGTRRYWVIHVKTAIDVEWVLKWRDQLWAEAYAAVQAGKRWHFDDPALERQRAEANERFRLVDPWQAKLSDFFDRNSECVFARIEDLLEDPLKLSAAQMPPGTNRRVARALRALGWEPGFEGGELNRIRGWKRGTP